MNTAPAPPKTEKLAVSTSLFLDVLRLSAALMVLFGHLTESFFATGWRDRTPWAIHAVIIFFLLSGFVIRYVTVRTPSSLRIYAIDRASRIYSVLLPALIFSFLTDTFVRHINMDYYINSPWPYDHILARAATQLTFTSEIWHADFIFLSNSPTWSLSYECFYYAFYGILFYLRGAYRVVGFLLAVLLAGPDIVFLFPIWLAGCLLFECFIRLRTVRWFLPVMAGSSVVVVVSGLLLRHWQQSHGAPWITHAVRIVRQLRDPSSQHSFLFFLSPHSRRSSPSNYLWAAIFFLLMLTALLLIDRIRVDARNAAAKMIPLLAEATFPLYLFHFPILVVAMGIFHVPGSSLSAFVLLFLFVFAISIGLGIWLNKFKLVLRQWLRKVFPVHA